MRLVRLFHLYCRAFSECFFGKMWQKRAWFSPSPCGHFPPEPLPTLGRASQGSKPVFLEVNMAPERNGWEWVSKGKLSPIKALLSGMCRDWNCWLLKLITVPQPQARGICSNQTQPLWEHMAAATHAWWVPEPWSHPMQQADKWVDSLEPSGRTGSYQFMAGWGGRKHSSVTSAGSAGCQKLSNGQSHQADPLDLWERRCRT